MNFIIKIYKFVCYYLTFLKIRFKYETDFSDKLTIFSSKNYMVYSKIAQDKIFYSIKNGRKKIYRKYSI